jgi:hypothetical protein
MTDSDWVSRLDPAPPAELATAIRNSLDEGAQNPSAVDLLEAAEHLLDKVLRTDCETRSSALDLLTVDALMTHALVQASTDPKSPEDFPEQAMRRVTSAWQ